MRPNRWPWVLAAALLLAGCTTIPGARDTAEAPPALTEETPAPADPTEVAVPEATITIRPGPDMSALRRKIKDYLSQQEGTYGIYVIDLASGKTMGINATKPFPAASTFKLPMALYILDQVAQGKANLNEKLDYTDADYEEGTGILQDSIEEGEQHPVRELLELAITQSDNIATRMLLRRFGLDNVFAYQQKLGGQVSWYDDETLGTTPRDMAVYMRYVQNASAVSDPALRQFLLTALENTAFNDRTAAGVPQGVPVAHKIGTLPNVVNDVALVEAPDHPFIVAAFSTDVSEDEAPEVISEVTRQIYEFLTNG